MAAKPGSLGWLVLADTFDSPQCREGVIVGLKDEWWQLLVRAKRPSEARGHFTTLEHDGKVFFLVEIPCHLLRAYPQESHLKLGVEIDELTKLGKGLIESDSELIIASATEEKGQPTGGRRQPQVRGRNQSSSESSDSDPGDTPLGALKKSWLGLDTSGEPRESQRKSTNRSRFPLLDKKQKNEKSEKGIEQLGLDAVLSQAQSGRDPLQALLAMQLLENMKDKKRLKHKKSKRDSSQSASSSESSSDESDSSSNRHRLRGHAKAVETYQSSKKRMFRRPLKHVRKYVREVEKDLGAENRAYHLSEIGKKINWGKQKSLQRCHYMLSDILTKLLKGQTEKATLQTVLCLRSIHQAALDNDWSIAWLLCHLPDPWTRRQWGGDPEDLGNVTAYLKSMAELNRNADRLRSASSWQTGDSTDAPGGDKKKKGKGKGKEKDEVKTE